MEDIDLKVRSKIYQQDYSPKPIIEGVKIVELVNHIGEDGDFSEIIKIKENLELEEFPGFKLRQINRSRLEPGTVKAWHLHLRQDEIWYLAPYDRLFVGLWDLRTNSKTKDTKMRLVLGSGKSQLLFIPKGVAHGSANFMPKAVELLYLVNQIFTPHSPDEQRLPWDSLGQDFWKPKRD